MYKLVSSKCSHSSRNELSVIVSIFPKNERRIRSEKGTLFGRSLSRKLFQYPVRADNSFATPLQTVIRTVGNADILRLNIEIPEGGE